MIAAASPSGIIKSDPVTFEVVRGGLYQACEEMKSTIMRAAFSPLLSLSADLSCAILDPQGDVVAQGNDIPVHLGAMPFTARAMLRGIPPAAWNQGDAVLCNDPYIGGTHLPDMTLMSPVHRDGRIIAFVACRVHWPDVGGEVPGSSSVTDHILKEGMRVPPVKIMEADRLNMAAVTILLANMRVPESRFGDLQAQCAGNRRGIARLSELIARYGSATITSVMEATQDHSEKSLAAGIATFPDGRFSYEETLDGDGYSDGGELRIRVSLRREAGKLVVDFEGTSGPTRGPVNAPFAVTASAVYYSVLAALGAGTLPNSGAYRNIDVRVPKMSLVAAEPPYPVVSANTETSNRIVDVILGAFAQAGAFGIAGSYGSAAVYTLGGRDPQTGKSFVHYETIGGGLGAGPRWDGTDGMRVHMGNTMNLPIEATEAALPIRFDCYALMPGSGGRGQHSGGAGSVKRLRSLIDHLEVSILIERTVSPARGRNGGADGALAHVRVVRAAGAIEEVPSKGRVVLAAQDAIEIMTAGGGGWGDRPRQWETQSSGSHAWRRS